ncbi:MAG: PEPxxWA-CTERM sorting domain-containing protein [Nitrosomonas sp.]|nr:PEPxxWA-CTERM sorting domain-containing protein [Nitrosomonas sp.]
MFAAPVPEPETWALLIAGLGLIGVAVHRRS